MWEQQWTGQLSDRDRRCPMIDADGYGWRIAAYPECEWEPGGGVLPSGCLVLGDNDHDSDLGDSLERPERLDQVPARGLEADFHRHRYPTPLSCGVLRNVSRRYLMGKGRPWRDPLHLLSAKRDRLGNGRIEVSNLVKGLHARG